MPATPEPVVLLAPPVMPVLVLVKLARSLSVPCLSAELELELAEEDPVSVRLKAAGETGSFMRALRCDIVVTGGGEHGLYAMERACSCRRVSTGSRLWLLLGFPLIRIGWVAQYSVVFTELAREMSPAVGACVSSL